MYKHGDEPQPPISVEVMPLVKALRGSLSTETEPVNEPHCDPNLGKGYSLTIERDGKGLDKSCLPNYIKEVR